jgi:hypothetical protein
MYCCTTGVGTGVNVAVGSMPITRVALLHAINPSATRRSARGIVVLRKRVRVDIA